ncbi:MAG: polysaccharide biosynthesis protein, partial [Clostridia bacterium]|nr:polysaccharide biosynthesis protein [Clostridia bacterium]
MKRPKLKTKSFTIRTLREWGILAVDLITVLICYLGAILLSQAYLPQQGYDLKDILLGAFLGIPIIIIVFMLSFIAFRVFKVVWRYARGRDYLRIVGACVAATVIYAILDQAFNLFDIRNAHKPEFVELKQITYPAYFMLSIFSISAIILFRILYEFIYAKQKDKLEVGQKKRTMIIGAGYTASVILEEISRQDSIYKPICLIDDDTDKLGRIINEVEVVGNTDEIAICVQKYAIDTIIFAIPSLDGDTRKKILLACNSTKCQVKVLPFVSEMIENVNITKQMRDINIADLLGRQQITFEDMGVASYIYDKIVMVTGGGGSIGSELCRQIAKYKPRRIVIIDVY